MSSFMGDRLMSDMPGIELVDAQPGRLRLRVQQIKRDPIRAALLEREIGKVPGILSVEAKALTASVLIRVDPPRLNTPQAMEHLNTTLRRLLGNISDQDLAPWLARLQGWLASTS
jgi:hypothetical protein